MKGYEMLHILISFLPYAIRTFFILVLAVIAIGSMVDVIKWFLRGGGQ